MLAIIGEETVPYRTVAIALEQIVSYCSEYLNREGKALLSNKLEERKYPKCQLNTSCVQGSMLGIKGPRKFTIPTRYFNPRKMAGIALTSVKKWPVMCLIMVANFPVN